VVAEPSLHLHRVSAFGEQQQCACVAEGAEALERTINVLGNGTLLASASVPHDTPEKIERWFRAHPLFGQHVASTQTASQPSAPQTSALIADELRKLAELRSEGILTNEEFSIQKARLLGT
jgi:hypothetical protein